MSTFIVQHHSLISSLQKLIEKKKAIKQGAMQELLTGKKRLPGFSGKWTNTTLGRCFSKIVGGGTPSRAISEFWNGEIPWATVKDFATFNPYKTQEYISEAGLNNSSTHLIPKGTLITSTRMGIGKIVIYYVDVAINQDLKALFISDDVSKEYIYHLFGMVGKIIESLGNGSTVKGIRIEQLKNLSIVLPKKNEQQAIAQVLSDMDSEIEQLEKKLAKYQQIKQGMMQELLTGRIRLVDADGKDQPQTQAVQKKQPQQAHNQHFDDAVMIAGIVNAFYSEKYPLGRKKVQKLLYLVRRKEQADISAFHKKAAGPYADEVRYKGGEPIAQKNKYILVKRNEKGSCFEKGAQMQRALDYLQDWGKQTDIDWLVSQFQYTNVNDLELFATVDMAICDLRREGKEISVASIKDLIRSNKEWRDKLKKNYFRDSDIQRAIKKCQDLFES